MSVLLKSLSPNKDAVLVTIAAPALIQELWESRNWVNPRVFLRTAQAVLSCLAVQALGEEDSAQSLEMQWSWKEEGLKAIYVASLFQGVARASYSWTGEASEEVGDLTGTFTIRRIGNNFETAGHIDSMGDIVADVQDVLLKSEQIDSALAVSVRWTIDESQDAPKLKITTANAYLLHVLPPELEFQRDDVLSYWHRFLKDLGSPADWVLPTDPEKAAQEMTNFIFVGGSAARPVQKLFSKKLAFFCNCSEEKVLKIVKILPQDEVDALEENFEVTCKFCGKSYRVEKSKSGLA